MDGPIQVAMTTHVDFDLKVDFQDLTDFMGVDPDAAIQEAVREWMTRYAVIHRYPKYGFFQGANDE